MEECVVLPKELREQEFYQKAIRHTHSNLYCQFSIKSEDNLELKAEHTYNGEKFCLLHLPFEAKKEKNLFDQANSYIIKYLIKNNPQKNFNFITACGLKIENKTEFNGFSFIGATLWSDGG